MTPPHSAFIEPVWIIGFTGHRPQEAPGRTSAEMEHLATLIHAELSLLKAKAEAQGGRAELLCGVAAGADLIAAREAAALGMVVHVILPMPESHFKEDFADPALEADWKKAQHFIELAKAGKDGATLRVAHGAHLRDDCYYDLGTEIVYASDAIIALWDGDEAPPVVIGEANGKSSPQRGGTKDVIDLATADVMPYVRTEPSPEGYAWLPTPVRLILTKTGEVTGCTDSFANDLDAGLKEIRSLQHAAETQQREGQPLDSVKGLMTFIDLGAQDWATKLRRGLLWGSAMHFTASLIAAVSAGSQLQLEEWMPPVFAGMEFLLVSTAFGIMIWSHFKHVQARWLELRLATELTRGLVGVGRLLDPLFPLCTDHLPGWRRFCISVGLTIWRDSVSQTGAPGDSAEAVFEKSKARYLEERIQDQLRHYGDNDPHRKHWWHRFIHYAGPVTAFFAVAFAAISLEHKWEVAALHEGGHDGDFFSSLIYYFLPIALPLLAGAIASLQSVTDVKRRALVYPEMVERLVGARAMLPAIRTQASLRRFARRTEEILLDELVGWYAAAKGISH
jgi:hypothetical protein